MLPAPPPPPQEPLLHLPFSESRLQVEQTPGRAPGGTRSAGFDALSMGVGFANVLRVGFGGFELPGSALLVSTSAAFRLIASD